MANKDVIFVVEDDKMYSAMVEYKLKEHGNSNIKKFYSGEECLKNMYLNPTVVVLDYQLPNINGLETLRQIKEQSPETAIVALTNTNDSTIKKQFLDAGVYEYFQKGKDTYDQICNTIDHLLWLIHSKRDEEGKTQNAVSLLLLLITVGIIMVHIIISH